VAVRRGLFRLWIVVTVCWIALVGWFASEVTGPDEFVYVAALAFLPPGIVFALGAALVWTLSGFRRNA
jgi:hypothetical protein